MRYADVSAPHPRTSGSAGRQPGTGVGTSARGLVALQARAGNAAVAGLVGRLGSQQSVAGPVQRCGPGSDCACPPEEKAAAEEVAGPPVQRVVSAPFLEAMTARRFPGSAEAHPPLLDVVQVFRGLSDADRRDTVRALSPSQQIQFAQLNLNNRDDTVWRVLIESMSGDARVAVVRELMRAGRMNEPQAPWGAYGVLNGLSDADQAAALRLLFEPERRRLQQGLATAPIDRLRMERLLSEIAPDAVPPVRRVPIPVTWVATELPPRTATAAGASALMGSRGFHGPGSGMQIIGTQYWRAYVPRARAIELQRGLDLLPQDLSPHFTTRMAGTPPGQAPQFPWVSSNVGAMDRPFTVAELQSIPELVRRYNANNSALSPAELSLLRRSTSLHVGGAHRGGSPFVSWSAPPAAGARDPISFMGSKEFLVRAEFSRADVLDNVRAHAANTLGPAEQAAGFEVPLNPDEAEWLATAESEARVMSVQPLRGGVRGEVVPGSAAWMARNARPLRYAGHGLMVVSFAISGYRVLTANDQQFAHVLGEEIGGQALGFGGAVLAGAACVGLGIATGGVGLVLCGMAGGLLGGMVGSAVGGAAADQLGRQPGQSDPFGLMGGQGGGPWLMAGAPPEVLQY